MSQYDCRVGEYVTKRYCTGKAGLEMSLGEREVDSFKKAVV